MFNNPEKMKMRARDVLLCILKFNMHREQTKERYVENSQLYFLMNFTNYLQSLY